MNDARRHLSACRASPCLAVGIKKLRENGEDQIISYQLPGT